jgi:hypothetical protein
VRAPDLKEHLISNTKLDRRGNNLLFAESLNKRLLPLLSSFVFEIKCSLRSGAPVGVPEEIFFVEEDSRVGAFVE